MAAIKKHTRQMMMAKLLARVASNLGKVTNGGSVFWWQSYHRGEQQMMAMQRKELSSESCYLTKGNETCSSGTKIEKNEKNKVKERPPIVKCLKS